MALFVIAFTIVAISISLLKQTINNRVYHIGQLHVLGALRNLVQLSHRRKWFFDSDYNKKDMKSQFDFKFFSELLISGGIGCVVDVRSNKKSRLMWPKKYVPKLATRFLEKKNACFYFNLTQINICCSILKVEKMDLILKIKK